MTLLLEEDEAPDPSRLSLRGAQGEAAHPDDGADAAEELRLPHGLAVSAEKC
jgi:hypothetical protein